MSYFYENIVWPLQKTDNKTTEKIYACDVFERAIFEFDKIIDPLNLPDNVKMAFKEELMKKFTPKPVKVKAVFRMTCRSKNGIEDIKSALKKGYEASKKDIPL